MILTLSDNTTTCDLIWHSAYNRKYILARDGWAPQVTRLRTSPLGRGPYTDVEEEIEIHILGGTEAEVLANLASLTRLLDRAERFWRGENVAPVLMHYAPSGASLVGVALVLGPAPGNEASGINLPITTNRDVNMLMIASVRLRLLRSGLWLNRDVETASAGAASNPTVQSATLATNQLDSAPTMLRVTQSAIPAALTSPPVILWASGANRLAIFEAESGTLGGQTTSVADATGKARGGNVARYTPTGTAQNLFFSVSLASMDAGIRRLAVWAVARNNSSLGTTTFLLQLQSPVNVGQRGPMALVDASAQSQIPNTVFLGMVSLPIDPASLAINVQASAASGSLDIDYIVVLAVDDERSGALICLVSAASWPLTVDPRPLTAVVPLVYLGTTPPVLPMGYLGNAMIHTAGQTVYMTVIQPTGTYWRQVNQAGSVVLDNTWVVNRNNATLTPQ